MPTLSAQQSTFIPLLSLIIPGSGQFTLKKRWRGALIFLAALVLGFLVNWTLLNLNIGKITLGGLVTSWLWLPFVLFWAWNVLDGRQMAMGRQSHPLPGVLLAAVILYVIAWNVTGIHLDRLVTRFKDARTVMTNLVNPDLVSISVNNENQVCSWQCIYKYYSDKQAGRTPAYQIKVSDNVLTIFGQVKPHMALWWEIDLGMGKQGEQVTNYEAGKLIETIAMGLMATLFSTILAIPISFLGARNVMSRFPGGMAIYYVMRTIFNVVRAVDTVVWGLLLIVWVGLGSFTGVIALTIHSTASLAKLFSEEIEHIDPGPVEALTATGANLFQVLRFAVLPQIFPPFLGYSLLRWDINMRAATVVGFVAGGGIGFFVIETIRQGGYQQYATALWAVAVVIILVDTISARWRESILKDKPGEIASTARSTWRWLSAAAYVVLGLAVFAYCWVITEIDLKSLFEPAPTFLRLLHDFISLDLSGVVVNTVIQQMIITVFQALLATTLGAIVALPFSFLAARNLTGRSWLSRWIYYITRGLFNILRSIEALLYVAIFVVWVGIGPFAGMLALAITTYALIGKLFSEAIENIDAGPIEAVSATGSNALQVVDYAILPQIIPSFVSYLIYQWDINIRMATIIGFAGGGGIGLTLSTFFGQLQYHKAGTVVACIVIVVALMDFASAKLREQLV